jgi:hypothetical protein
LTVQAERISGSLTRLTMKNWKIYLISAFAFIGGIYFLYSGYIQYQLSIVAKDGIVIEGKIKSHSNRSILGILSDKGVDRVTYTYQYKGKSFTSTERIARTFFSSSRDDSTILIQINPDAPQHSMIKGNLMARSLIRIGYSDFLIVPWYINPLISLLLFLSAYCAYKKTVGGSALR